MDLEGSPLTLTTKSFSTWTLVVFTWQTQRPPSATVILSTLNTDVLWWFSVSVSMAWSKHEHKEHKGKVPMKSFYRNQSPKTKNKINSTVITDSITDCFIENLFQQLCNHSKQIKTDGYVANVSQLSRSVFFGVCQSCVTCWAWVIFDLCHTGKSEFPPHTHTPPTHPPSWGTLKKSLNFTVWIEFCVKTSCYIKKQGSNFYLFHAAFQKNEDHWILRIRWSCLVWAGWFLHVKVPVVLGQSSSRCTVLQNSALYLQNCLQWPELCLVGNNSSTNGKISL